MHCLIWGDLIWQDSELAGHLGNLIKKVYKQTRNNIVSFWFCLFRKYQLICDQISFFTWIGIWFHYGGSNKMRDGLLFILSDRFIYIGFRLKNHSFPGVFSHIIDDKVEPMSRNCGPTDAEKFLAAKWQNGE